MAEPVRARRLTDQEGQRLTQIVRRGNEGLACLDPKWAGGRPRLISTDDVEFIVETATTRPAVLGRPFTHWSIRKLADYLATADATKPAPAKATASDKPSNKREDHHLQLEY